jgi:integrase/recombinase XerD
VELELNPEDLGNIHQLFSTGVKGRHMADHNWQRYPILQNNTEVQQWLKMQMHLQLSPNTIQAYARALQQFLHFCEQHQIEITQATREHIALWLHEMAQPESGKTPPANATLQQRLTAVRLFYNYLIEEQYRDDNPVGYGRYTPGKSFGGARDRGLLPRFEKLPWIPNEEQWHRILRVARQETVRNRLMFALAYDSALRREEVCSVCVEDIDPAHQLVRIRAENTKNRQERVVPYSVITAELYTAYLEQRRYLTRRRGALFVSESPRNFGEPLSIWMWSKTIHRIAEASGVPELSTHTLRHLCLTNLARTGWDLHAIAQFAGHRSLSSTLRYIHLSGRDLTEQYQRTLATSYPLTGLTEYLT